MLSKKTGYLLGAIAAATYGMNPLFALPLYQEGMTADSVLFFRYVFALFLLAAMIVARGRSFRVQSREILPLAIMGLLMALSSLALFESYNYMDAGIASTLLFIYPILVALIMAVRFKEKVSLLTSGCILMALSGIALLYKSKDGATLSLIGTLFVFVSAFSYAVYIVSANRPRFKRMATLTMTFYVLLFGLSLFFFRLDFGTALQIPARWHHWGNLVALAVLPTAVSFLCTTKAIQCIGSTPTAVLGALEPVTAIFFGILVFGETLTLRETTGLALIIVAVTLVIAEGQITPYLTRFRKLFPRLPLRRKRWWRNDEA